MCKAIADMRSEERREGHMAGIKEGALDKAKETALNLREMGMNPEIIAKVVNEDIKMVDQWLKER